MFESIDFKSQFDQFTNYKVLIIGDVMIDTYLWGSVERVSPEAPVPIVSGVIEENRLGGAANVALNIKAMGAVPILCSVIGDDDRGKLILELLEEQLLTDIGLVVDSRRVTTQKTRIISGSQHLLRVDEEMDIFLNKRVQEEFLELISSLLESGGIDAIIMQDYDKGVLTPRVISEVISASERVAVPVLVDPKYRSFDLYKKVKLFKPNFKELATGLNLDIRKQEIEKLAEAVQKFQKQQQIENLMVTLSDQGVLTSGEGWYFHIPALKREITDVSGAGDTVIAIAALCVIAGFSPAEVAAVSNMAGGQVCEKAGVVPVNLEKLLSECNEHFKNS
ncbi:MAG: D-glycero-beta-D-manno-heptose-7-phosphate kinase [Candidatus Atribacteria bacterium]|nr:MAG: D-glycero-beta-D-manno-heptose-7-phosphate kinase [Candidatus Atribacteria bacterium]